MPTKFHKHNIREVVRLTDISQVSDQTLWSTLLTPMLKALLGNIVSSHIEERHTVAGRFPGDEASNLNDHRLHGGQTGFVRYPYLVSTYETEYGAFIVKRDGTKFEVFCWFGNLKKCELLYKTGLRDRRYDGTREANDTALLEFPYDDPVLNKPRYPQKVCKSLN